MLMTLASFVPGHVALREQSGPGMLPEFYSGLNEGELHSGQGGKIQRWKPHLIKNI